MNKVYTGIYSNSLISFKILYFYTKIGLHKIQFISPDIKYSNIKSNECLFVNNRLTDNKFSQNNFAGKKNLYELEANNFNNIQPSENKNNLLYNQLFNNYFELKQDLPEIPIDINFTDKEKIVLNYLKKHILFSMTDTYKQLAIQVFNNSDYARYIGTVMKNNPLPLYYPCHRILGTNGKLKGFSQGIHLKKFLLKFESL